MPKPTKKEIEIRKLERDTNLTKIARIEDVTPEMICMVLSRKARSSRLEKAIAKALDYDVYTLFPDHDPRPRRGVKAKEPVNA